MKQIIIYKGDIPVGFFGNRREDAERALQYCDGYIKEEER